MHELLDDTIIEAINTILCEKKKRPDVNSIFEYLNKELHNPDITSPLLIPD